MNKIIFKNVLEGAASVQEGLVRIFLSSSKDFELKKSQFNARAKEYAVDFNVDIRTANDKVFFWRMVGQFFVFLWTLGFLGLTLFLVKAANFSEIALIALILVGYTPLISSYFISQKYKKSIN